LGRFRDLLFGPWRAVAVLSVTQILAWGAVYYTPVLMVPLIAAERGWTTSFAMGGFSLGILVTGLVAPRMGGLIDRYGGHRVMPFGSLIGAAGLVGLSNATTPAAYLAAWTVLGVAMAASLYDAAFATLGRIFGARARRPITVLTLAGAFASTVSWPTTHALNVSLGWHATYLVYAAVLLLVAAPLHAFALPRTRAEADVLAPGASPAIPSRPLLPAAGPTFVLVAAAFASYAFVPAGLLAHMLAMFERLGIEPTTAVAIGALFGPCQMTARLGEFLFARDVHPLAIVRFAVALLAAGFAILALLGLSAAVAAAFVILLGLSNGLVTIARGAVPLALFGASGYGRLIGRLAAPSLIIQAAAPFVVAIAAERTSDIAAIALAGSLVLVSLACFLAIRPPRAPAIR
jgi:MFS family permease